MSDEISFEEFNDHINASHDDGCSMCFSFYNLSHLDQGARKLAYLAFIQSSDYYLELASELEKREDLPIDDNTYWMIMNIEPAIKLDSELSVRIMIQVLRRANEMVLKKMATAWVAVRSYAWMDNNDPLLLVAFLDQTDDPDVWQVIFQQLNWNIPQNEHYKSLSLSAMRDKVHEFTFKAIELCDNTTYYVVAANGIQALAALQDYRVLNVAQHLPRRSLDRNIRESASAQISYLSKTNQLDFIYTLERLKEQCRAIQ